MLSHDGNRTFRIDWPTEQYLAPILVHRPKHEVPGVELFSIDQLLGTLDALRHDWTPEHRAHSSQLCGVWLALEVSRGGFLQNRFVQFRIG